MEASNLQEKAHTRRSEFSPTILVLGIELVPFLTELSRLSCLFFNFISQFKFLMNGTQWQTPLNPVLRRQRQIDV